MKGLSKLVLVGFGLGIFLTNISCNNRDYMFKQAVKEYHKKSLESEKEYIDYLNNQIKEGGKKEREEAWILKSYWINEKEERKNRKDYNY